MKDELNNKPGKLSGLVQNTVNFGKKTAADAKSSVVAIVEKSKANSFARRMRKYNPLFPEQYLSEGFSLPNIIMIVDDAVRRGIDVCEGAIGWLTSESGVEVLCLYDEAVAFSGIQFVPSVSCDAFYYVDSFNRKRFIRTDCVFDKAHDDNIKYLVEMCCSGKRTVKTETLELSGSSSATMSQKTACALDAAIGKMGGMKGNSSMDAQAKNEHQSKLLFHIEF